MESFFPNCVDDFERFSGSVCRVLRKFVRRFSPTAPFYLINTSNIFSICQIHLGMVQELCKNKEENTLVSENWPFTYFGWKHTFSLKQQFFIIQQPLFGTKWRNCSCVRILFSKNTQIFSSPAYIIQCFLFSTQEAVHVLFLREKMLISTCTEHRSENQDFRQQMAAKLLLFLVIDSVHHFADMCTWSNNTLSHFNNYQVESLNVSEYLIIQWFIEKVNIYILILNIL